MNSHLFSADMKLADVIHADYSLLLLLHRFGINLGFGDKTVRECCEANHVSCTLFLMICNVYSNEQYLPTEKEIEGIGGNVDQLIAYLKNSHSYYLENRMLSIQEQLKEISEGCEQQHQQILNLFFNEYKNEVIRHFDYEEVTVFPYISNMVKGARPGDYEIDLLDMEPKNSLTYGNSMTEKELEASVRGAQAIIRTYMMMHYNNGSNYVNGSYADEVEYTLSLRRNLDPQVIPGGDWGQHYNVISVANRTIYLAKHSDLDQDRKNLYLGQGYFLKAFIYYDLLKEWGECVLIKDEVEPKPVAKSPWTEIADYAIEVAQEAVDALPDFSEIKDSKGQYASYKSTPCKGAANALLAHLCAWKAGGKYFAREDQRNYDERELWLRAERACSWVIDSSV